MYVGIFLDKLGCQTHVPVQIKKMMCLDSRTTRTVLVRVQVYVIGQRLMYSDYTSKPNKNINNAISMVQLGENRSTRPWDFIRRLVFFIKKKSIKI